MGEVVTLSGIAAATAVVYLFLVALFRFLGRRALAELSPVDLVVMLCLGSAVETAMIRADTSLAAGLTSAATLLLTNRILTSAVVRHKWLRRLVNGGPTLLVHNGRFLANRAARCGLSRSDVEQAVRQRDLERLDQVRFAVLEADGEITVVPAA